MIYAIKIGRDSSNDIVITDPKVSRNHAIISVSSNQVYEVKDLGSTNGTYINGKKIIKQILQPGEKLRVASRMVDWETAVQKFSRTKIVPVVSEEPVAKIQKTLSIGSSDDNDIVIKNSYISSHHAQISLLKNGGYYLRDLNSRNGSYINGLKVSAKNISPKDAVKIANSDLPGSLFKMLSPAQHKAGTSAATFALPTMGGLSFVDTANILYCEGASNQTMVYLEGNKKELVSRTLRECGELLSRSNFSGYINPTWLTSAILRNTSPEKTGS